MPKVEFTADFTWTAKTNPGTSIAYKAGMCLDVTKACAKAAILAKRARLPRQPKKEQGNGEGSDVV